MPYRLGVLDRAIRAQRTLHEAEMMHRAKKAGVGSPYLYFIDLPGSTIIMEYLEGPRMKDSVSADGSVSRRLFRTLGSEMAKLHISGVMHGDLTTSNVIIRGDKLVFIDFGLAVSSTRLEDFAVDLRLVKETVAGAHSGVAEVALNSLLRGYREIVGESRFIATMKQLRAIERRGRYARVD
jgi:TP53 regulating kinase and related kinases